MARKRTYEQMKAAVLAAGRFSTFEAQDDPALFHQLLRDPDVEEVDMPYPWIGVRRKAPQSEAETGA